MNLRQSDRLMDDTGITTVKAACNIGRTDQWHDLRIVSNNTSTVTFTHVAVEIDPVIHVDLKKSGLRSVFSDT
jgi:hypothetical protein